MGLLLAALAGCDDAGITTPDRDPFLTGLLVGLNGCDFTEACIAVVPESVETLWAKTDLEDPCGVILGVDEDTELLVREGSALRRATVTDFTPFRELAVWVVGDIVAAHMDLDIPENAPVSEAEVVYLADKYVEADRIVPIEKRFDEKARHFQNNPDALARLHRRRQQAVRINKRLEAHIGKPLASVIFFT